MIEIQIHGIDEIIATLNRIAAKTANKTNLMQNIAGTMESAVLTNFDEGGRPKWLGIKHRQGTPLVDTENLMGSITSDYDNDSAIVGTNESYAAIHQFGGMAGRGRKVKIEARPFLQLTSQDRQDILDDVQAYWQKLLD
ncbi:phage virion morphogenesis protein [Mannheimia haemolytica]|uniref:phage virion morphogenesis protein n=1 Tax=Mannheimia haemolytica TaxID=75985 RepID=UPI00201C6ED3|nr:phage virion morphogenesis protein [Mannheimia haemolytica]UQX70103.1 phage virion morphogenesis protein [Mannheimia haemolytica]